MRLMNIPELPYWAIPRCWPGECVAILGGGLSLRQEQVDHCRGRCRVIAINRAFKLAPWSDWLYGCDSDRFWTWHPEALEFDGTKVVVRKVRYYGPAYWRQLQKLADAGVKILKHSAHELPALPRHEGVSNDPGVVRGDNSGFQILSVIHHTGASTVLLLGFDQHGRHWHGGYADIGVPDYAGMIPRLESLVKPLEQAGVCVLNCSPGSAVPYWDRADLFEVI
jgi:hypothetical protein